MKSFINASTAAKNSLPEEEKLPLDFQHNHARHETESKVFYHNSFCAEFDRFIWRLVLFRFFNDCVKKKIINLNLYTKHKNAKVLYLIFSYRTEKC